ncbi:MAG: DUF5665 domain-containing protein [Bacillota bacterium]|nr:DUF5665 domain-containing protein [Bacillota bacterium]
MVSEQDQQSKLDRLATALERARIGEYVELSQRPLRLIYLSFLSGLARGFGIVIGFTVIGAAVVYILQRVLSLNLPGISRTIADLIRLVQQNMVR